MERRNHVKRLPQRVPGRRFLKRLSLALVLAGCFGVAGATAVMAEVTPVGAGVYEYNHATHSYRPVRVAVTTKKSRVSGVDRVEAPMRPPVTNFSASRQHETYLTQFIMGYNKNLSWQQANLIAESILTFSNHYQVDFRLVTGVIAVESSFRTDAISKSGAIGLGQLKPDTAQWLGVVNPFDPIDNVAGMSRYLSYLINKYDGNLDSALSAYYQGPGATDRQGISDTAKDYLYRINAVLSRM